MANRRHHPRAFGLLFAAGELLSTANPPVSHFIEGTIYQEEGQLGLNAAGRAESLYEDAVAHPVVVIEYDSLTDLGAQLGLDQNGVNVLVGRITESVNRR